MSTLSGLEAVDFIPTLITPKSSVAKSMITLYEPPSCLSDQRSLSPWSLLVRAALTSKSIPYQTNLVRISSLPSFGPSIGAPSTGNHADGSPKYTFPIIKDNRGEKGKGTVVADSLAILQYLDKTHPAPRSLFPHTGQDASSLVTLIAHTLGHGSSLYNTLLAPEWKRHMPLVEYDYWEAQLKRGGGLLGHAIDPETWRAPEAGSTEFEAVIQETRNGLGEILQALGNSEWFTEGSHPTYPDFALLAHLEMVRLWRPEVFERLVAPGEKDGVDGERLRRYLKSGEKLLVFAPNERGDSA